MNSKKTQSLSKDALAAFDEEFNAKFLATRDAEGAPNVAPVISLSPGETPDILLFGRLMIQKTRVNLLNDPRVGLFVFDARLRGWGGTGDFEGFADSGRDYECINKREMIRYNAYTGFGEVGRIAIRKMHSLGRLSPLALLAAQLREPGKSVKREAERGKGLAPPQVISKFIRVKAVRAFSWIDQDGYPRCCLAKSVGFPSVDRMTVSLAPGGPTSRLKKGTPIAVAVITMDPIAYQIKGRVVSGKRRKAEIEVTRVYSSSPQLPGEDLSKIRMANA